MTESTHDMARTLGQQIAPVFQVDHVQIGGRAGAEIMMYGRLQTEPGSAYRHIRAAFDRYGYSAFLRHHQGYDVVVARPAPPQTSHRDRLAPLLFVLTIASVLVSAAWWQTGDLGGALRQPWIGLPFATGLLGVLAAHEFGHWIVARRLGVAVSLPYFIPLPLLNLFGTMGAIMRMEELPRSRRQMLAIGAAGPLFGLVVGIPLLVIGLFSSTVEASPLVPGVIQEGNSILYALLKFVVFRRWLPGGGLDVFLHPVAFGAWGGLFVTALNLIPAGQLDGGHVARALLGEKTRWLNRAAVLFTAALSLVWSGWLLWAGVLLLFGQRSVAPLDDVTPLSPTEKALAVGMLILFVLLFTPQPLVVLM